MRKVMFFIFILCFTIALPSLGLSIETKDLSREALSNGSYITSISEKPISLKNGKSSFEGFMITLEDFLTISSRDQSKLEAVAILLSIRKGEGPPSYEVIALVPKEGRLVQLKPFPLGEVNIKRWWGKLEMLSFPPTERWVVNIELELKDGETEIVSLCQKGDSIAYTQDTVVRKPAIYLYPKKREKIRIRLRVNGEIVRSDPQYNGEWVVEADPSGALSNGYRYLFYEARIGNPIRISPKGWLVRREDLSRWLDETLPRLGLKGKEIGDFKEYWLENLPEAPYYLIRRISKEYVDENLALEIDPRPDRAIRVLLLVEPKDNPERVEPEDRLTPPERTGFTVVEWGVVIKGGIEVKEQPKVSKNQRETGLILIKGFKLEGPLLTIRVDSGGCTNKDSIEVKVKEEKSIVKGFKHYSLYFIRRVPDECKALLPEGVEITYDLLKELKLTPPFTITIGNPLTPLLSREYLEIKPAGHRVEEVSPELLLKMDLIEATKRAIQAEIKRYESRTTPEPDKIEFLKRELERLKNMKPEAYPLGEGKHDPLLKFGVLMPPMVTEVEIVSLPELGGLLMLTKQSKSGPFFHVAGIAKNALLKLKPNAQPPFKARIYLVYKREYFLMIPDYYVYVEEVSPLP